MGLLLFSICSLKHSSRYAYICSPEVSGDWKVTLACSRQFKCLLGADCCPRSLTTSWWLDAEFSHGTSDHNQNKSVTITRDTPSLPRPAVLRILASTSAIRMLAQTRRPKHTTLTNIQPAFQTTWNATQEVGILYLSRSLVFTNEYSPSRYFVQWFHIPLSDDIGTPFVKCSRTESRLSLRLSRNAQLQYQIFNLGNRCFWVIAPLSQPNLHFAVDGDGAFNCLARLAAG